MIQSRIETRAGFGGNTHPQWSLEASRRQRRLLAYDYFSLCVSLSLPILVVVNSLPQTINDMVKRTLCAVISFGAIWNDLFLGQKSKHQRPQHKYQQQSTVVLVLWLVITVLLSFVGSYVLWFYTNLITDIEASFAWLRQHDEEEHQQSSLSSLWEIVTLVWNNSPPLDAYEIVGFVLILSGTMLRQYCMLVLGKYFTLDIGTFDDHVFVEDGPYRYLMHPSYLGGMLFEIGVPIFTKCYILGSIFPICFFLCYKFERIPHEEQMLLENFGEKYEIALKKKYKVIPFIW